MSQSGFDIEDRWPELFEPLSAEERRMVIQTLAASWHEGWEPNREEVVYLCDFASGAITMEEYQARADEYIERRFPSRAVS